MQKVNIEKPTFSFSNMSCLHNNGVCFACPFQKEAKLFLSRQKCNKKYIINIKRVINKEKGRIDTEHKCKLNRAIKQ